MIKQYSALILIVSVFIFNTSKAIDGAEVLFGAKFYTHQHFKNILQNYQNQRPWISNNNEFNNELYGFKVGLIENFESYMLIVNFERFYNNNTYSGIQPLDYNFATRKIDLRNTKLGIELHKKINLPLIHTLGLGFSTNIASVYT